MDVIKIENDEAFSECETTKTEDVVIEIKQEIITDEDFTNIDTQSSLPMDFDPNCVKVETSVETEEMKQSAVDGSATNADVKSEFIGEDYSSCDNSSLAGTKLMTQHGTETRTDSSQAKAQTQCRPAADHRLTVDEKLAPHKNAHKTASRPQWWNPLPRSKHDEIKLNPFKVIICCEPNKPRKQIVIYCEICGSKFRHKGKLKFHMKKHAEEKPFICEICHKQLKSKYSLRKHVKEVHLGEKPYPCVICPKRFSVQKSLARHMRIHSCDDCQNKICLTQVKIDKDSKCQVGFGTEMKKSGVDGGTTNADILKGILKDGDYSSGDKNLLAATSQNAKTIVKAEQHSTERLEDSSRAKMLNDNLTSDNPHPTSSYKPQLLHNCYVCNKQFIIKRYRRPKNTERPFSCEVCQKTYTTARRVTEHMRSHSGEKPYTCDICHMAFARKPPLIVHLRRHSGEKPFSCEVCNRKFIGRANLTAHMSIHLKQREKPHSCDVCHRKFAVRRYLVCHMRTHSGEKPYSCEVCHKSFSQKSPLNTHMSIHTGNKRFSCKLCHNTTFRLRSLLQSHIIRTHSGEYPE